MPDGANMSRHHYYLSIADLAHARGDDPRFSYDGVDPRSFAVVLQQSLRSDELFQRWRAVQPEPDAVDPGLGEVDADAQVSAQLADLHTEVDLLTSLPMSVVRHRLYLLIGAAWQLRDLRAA
jgi:hypothetical protein